MNLQNLTGKRECILNPRLVFRIQLCSRIQMCTLWSQFSKIFTYKRILRGLTPKCQHLFYLTAFILFSDIITTTTRQTLESSLWVQWWTRRTWRVTHEVCQPVALSWEGRIAVWFSLFFLISFLKSLHLILL